MANHDTAKSGKDPKSVFHQAEKRMERVRFNNYRAERRLKDDLEGLDKSEQFKMTELRHQVLLLQMELRSRRCKEAVMILKDGLSDSTLVTRPKVVKSPPIEKKKDDPPKQEVTSIHQRWHQICYPRVFLSEPNPETTPTPPVNTERRFSVFVSQHTPFNADHVRDIKTAPPLITETTTECSVKRRDNSNKILSDFDESFSDDEVFSDDIAIERVTERNNSKHAALFKKATKLLINSKRIQSVDDEPEADMYTDGSMALAMRQLEHKRRATMPALTGHLPMRKRSVVITDPNDKNKLRSLQKFSPKAHNFRSKSAHQTTLHNGRNVKGKKKKVPTATLR